MQDLDHKHLIVTAALKNPPTTVELVEDWLRRVVEAVDMVIMFGPQVARCETPGNEGVTGIVCIETSHAAIHVWETADVPYLKFDLYSCKRFDPTIITEMLKEFDPYFANTMLIDRNDGIKVLSEDDVQYASIMEMLSPEQQTSYNELKKLDKSQWQPHHRAARVAYVSLTAKYSIRTLRRAYKYKKDFTQAVTLIKSRCKRLGLDFDLTKEWFKAEVEIAKAKWPKLVVHRSGHAFWGAEVDRIDPTQGYTQVNCRIIPAALNRAKWSWNPSEIAQLVDLVAEEAVRVKR